MELSPKRNIVLVTDTNDRNKREFNNAEPVYPLMEKRIIGVYKKHARIDVMEALAIKNSSASAVLNMDQSVLWADFDQSSIFDSLKDSLRQLEGLKVYIESLDLDSDHAHCLDNICHKSLQKLTNILQ